MNTESLFKLKLSYLTGTTTSNLLDGAVLTINSTTYNLNLATLSTSTYGSVLPYTILTVNAPIYGTNGANGNEGLPPIANGINGSWAINFNGFSGKTVKIINNSTIRGGNGGNGWTGMLSGCTTSYTSVGGDGGLWKINDSGVTFFIERSTPLNGGKGTNGAIYDTLGC